MIRILTVSTLLLLFSDIAFAIPQVNGAGVKGVNGVTGELPIIEVADRTLPRDINRLEDTFFNQHFDEDSQDERINRLEYRVFGALQNGSCEERIQKLKRASLNYRSQRVMALENEFYPYYNQPAYTTKSGWKGVFGNLNNYFNGCPTGMTPQIYYPPNVYPNMYHRTGQTYSPYGYGNNQYVRTRNGYRYNGRNADSGTGVTILN